MDAGYFDVNYRVPEFWLIAIWVAVQHDWYYIDILTWIVSKYQTWMQYSHAINR